MIKLLKTIFTPKWTLVYTTRNIEDCTAFISKLNSNNIQSRVKTVTNSTNPTNRAYRGINLRLATYDIYVKTEQQDEAYRVINSK